MSAATNPITATCNKVMRVTPDATYYEAGLVIGSTDIPASAVGTVLTKAGKDGVKRAYRLIGDAKWTISRAKTMDALLATVARKVA